MKASSCPNLYRKTTSFPNFFTLLEQPDHHDTTTLNKRRKVDHGEDTEGSETSPPFKDILSPFASFNEMNENHYPVGGSFNEWDEMDQTLPRWPPRSSGSDTNVSVGSNQLSGNVGEGSEGPNFTQLRWDLGNHPDFPEDEFRRAFKMSKSTFNLICTQLEPMVDEKDMMLPLALPFTPAISQRVAVCIWHLATGEPLRLVSKRFGLDISTCYKFLLEVCHAIKNVLMIKFLNWPDEEKMKAIKSEFESLSGIPNVGGSMYTTHVPISAQELNGHAYFSKSHTERTRKASYTVTVQGVVDSRGVFTDVCIGQPGSMHDDKILETSEISLRANQGLLKDVWIVGNSGYPLMDWVLVPYTQQNMWLASVFNGRVGRVQRVAKEACRRLKARWRCLQEMTEVELQDLHVVLGACCVLHNICEMSNEAMDPADAIFEIFDDAIVPKNTFEIFDDEIVPENRMWSFAAMQARDQIACHLLRAANKRFHSLEQLIARLK